MVTEEHAGRLYATKKEYMQHLGRELFTLVGNATDCNAKHCCPVNRHKKAINRIWQKLGAYSGKKLLLINL